MKLNCIRINSVTNIVTNEIHSAKTRIVSIGNDKELCVFLEPGVTGHESFLVKDFLKGDHSKPWYACAGTPNRWDTLIVPVSELNRLIDILELFPDTLIR